MNTSVRNALVSENIGLVHSCCQRFKGRGVEYDDLFQAGCLGLIRAAEGFDSERGIMFSTYAFPAIMGEIRRLFRDGGTVKVSRSMRELYLKASRESERLSKKLGREPTVSELAVYLGVSAEETAQALCAAQPTVSLTSGVEEDDGAQIDLPQEDETERLCDEMSLRQAISELEERDRRLITMRYFSGMTQVQTAQRLGMTQVQVSRRERRAIERIRAKLM